MRAPNRQNVRNYKDAFLPMKIGFLDTSLLQRNVIIIFSKDEQDWALDLMPVLSFTDNPCVALQKELHKSSVDPTDFIPLITDIPQNDTTALTFGY